MCFARRGGIAGVVKFFFFEKNGTAEEIPTMGRRQVVRHRILVPAFGGSNPSAPANFRNLGLVPIFLNLFVKNLNPNPGFDAQPRAK